MVKKIVITGAGGILGKACITSFQKKGHQIVAILSPGKKLSYTTISPVSVYNADLMDESNTQEVMDQVIKDHQTIDTALLLVGGFAMGTINNTDGTLIKKMISLNFETAYYSARVLFNQMAKQKDGGKIVFVGSRPSLDAKAGKGVLAYALSKTLVFKLAEILNEEGKEKNIVSSVFVPSIIDTPDNRKAMPKTNTDLWVKPEEIAEIMEFATSEKGMALREPVIKVYGKS
ncbi:MAG: SDR family NAD(P)-dependent oxidoreductase [Cyclobacteriaceae bacterium]|nr:SDR family NAD(P)-dependent oxidoreductase [Cyclobacteriaceae bacterium]